MDIELSLGALEAFYQTHDPSKLNTVDDIYEKYPAYKLVSLALDLFFQFFPVFLCFPFIRILSRTVLKKKDTCPPSTHWRDSY